MEGVTSPKSIAKPTFFIAEVMIRVGRRRGSRSRDVKTLSLYGKNDGCVVEELVQANLANVVVAILTFMCLGYILSLFSFVL